jgi:hypothetical protein
MLSLDNTYSPEELRAFPERIFRLAAELLGRIQPQVGTDPTGSPTVSFSIGSAARDRLDQKNS